MHELMGVIQRTMARQRDVVATPLP